MPPPTLDQRLAVRQRPAGPAFMRNRWEHLLFLHWALDPQLVQARLPAGLSVDTFDGQAWLGVVPFFMRGVRLAGGLPLSLGDFLELNVRTYVYDAQGRPGVWFFALDCNHPLAVLGARWRYSLPYQHALMRARPAQQGWAYHSRRPGQRRAASYLYRPRGEAAAAAPDSLEFFLVERYLLFSQAAGRLCSGQVWHAPYEVQPVELLQCTDVQLELNGFSLERPPDHALYCARADVEIFALQRSAV